MRAAFNILVDKLACGDREKASQAARELIMEGEKFTPLLLERAQFEKDVDLKCQLIDIIGKIGDLGVAGALLYYLHSPEAKVRRQACISLGWLRYDGAIEKLEEIAQKDPHKQVRAEARQALREIYDIDEMDGGEERRNRPDLPESFRLHMHSFMQSFEKKGLIPLVENIPRDVRLDLMKVLPKFLAMKYEVVPVALDEDGSIHVYSAKGCLGPDTQNHLAALTCKNIIHNTANGGRGEILNALERLYSLGLDDYCYFWEELRPEVSEELKALVLEQIDGHADISLTECADDPAAWQQCRGAHDFLNMAITFCLKQNVPAIVIDTQPQHFDFYYYDEEGGKVALPLPPPLMRARVPEVIYYLSDTHPPSAGQRSSGKIHVKKSGEDEPTPILIDVSEHLGRTRINISVFV